MKTILISMLLLPLMVRAQSVGIGTQNPNASAMLDVSSSSKGLLIPRMTENQKNQIANPATGLLIWQTDGMSGFYYNHGTPQNPKWYMLSVENETNWKLTGNISVDSATHFLGSINKAPVYFKVRNTFAGQLDSAKATLFGYKAGWQSTSTSTTAFGTEALAAPSEEPANTAFGHKAAFKTRSGGFNTAIGAESLYENISGSANTAVGLSAMYYNLSGSRNVAVGAGALTDSDTADDNTAVGYLALENNKADHNTAVGSLALAANTSGFQNTAIGYRALRMNVIGNQNTAIGRGALSSNISGNENTAVGQSALFYNTEGYNNNAMGDAALFQNTTGIGNTAIGRWALRENTIASENVAVGNYALQKNTTLGGNTAVGHAALTNNTKGGNTAFGHDAARQNTTGDGITAIGFDALKQNTTGSNNTALGSSSLSTNTAGMFNTAVGSNALLINTTGGGNTVLGSSAGSNLVTGTNNTLLGTFTNASSGDPFNATAVGFRAFVDCNNCLVLGSVAGVNNANNSVNVGIGTTTPTEVLTINATNPILQLQHAGANMGFMQITGGQDVKIGTNITNNLGSFFIRTNGADRVKVEPNGNVGVGTSSPAVRFQVGTNGDGTVARANAWQTFSDARFKKDIVPIGDALQKLNQMQGYYYHWTNGKDDSRQAGFLAQEVEKVMPEIVSTDTDGYKSVDYGKMNALLIQAIKEQQTLIDNLTKQMKALISNKQIP
jgi:hypothetical protein